MGQRKGAIQRIFSELKAQLLLPALLLILMGLALGQVCLSPLEQLASEVLNLGYKLSSAEIEARLLKNREATVQLIKQVARGEVTEFINQDRSRTQLSRWEARMVLLRLPDAEVLDTIGKQLAEFQQLSPYASLRSDLFDEAVRAKQPRLIPYIVRSMFREGDAERTDFRMVNAGNINRSGYSVWVTMKLVEAVDEFAPSVKEWARAMQGAHHLSESEKRDIGRIWWKENESVIIAENYAAVRPGISPAAGMPRSQPNTLPNPDDARRVSPTDRSGPTTKLSNNSPVSVLSTVADGTASLLQLWSWWAGFVAVFVGMAAWLVMRSRRKSGRGPDK